MDDHAGVEVAAYYWHFVDVVWIVPGRARIRWTTTPDVEVAAYYWHFVDVVWIALFLTIFVIR